MIFFDGIVTALQRSGGITIYFEELLHRLSRDHIDFIFDSYDPSSVFNLLKFDNNTALQKSRLFERYRASRTIPDASLFHSTYYRLPRDQKLRTVTTVHDFTYEKKIGGIRSLVHSTQKRKSILHAHAVICVSDSTRRDLFKFIPECERSKVHVVHNGVSLNFKKISQIEPQSKIKKPFVIFVGARGGYKNFNIAVQVVALMGNVDLVAVGGGPLTNSEAAMVKKMLPGRFRHLGFISSADLNVLYNQAYALLYPSAYEGFGIPILEAMRAGCPVIAIDVSSIPEVGGTAALLADEPDVDAIFAEMKKLDSDSERCRIVNEGFEWSSRFSWEKTYRETMEIYSKTAKES